MSEELEQIKMILRSDWSKDLMGYEITMRSLCIGREPPKNPCGECSAYKTPFCTFAQYNDVIHKKDRACVDFYPDRHIPREKLKRKRVIMRDGRR